MQRTPNNTRDALKNQAAAGGGYSSQMVAKHRAREVARLRTEKTKSK